MQKSSLTKFCRTQMSHRSHQMTEDVSLVEAEKKRSQAKILEVENAPKKMKHFRPAAGGMSYGFETAFVEPFQEICLLFSKYSEVLMERATEDASLCGELEDIITEAKSLEVLLKEKKETLRQSLAMISDKLQG